MKGFKILILYTLPLWIASCSLFGGSSPKERLLTKKWKIVFNQESYIKNMTKEEKELYDKLPKEQKKAAIKDLDLAAKNTFEFKKDYTFELLLRGANEEKPEKKQAGTWSLNAEGNILILIPAKKKKEDKVEKDELTIKELTETKLVIIVKNKDTQELEEITLVSYTKG